MIDTTNMNEKNKAPIKVKAAKCPTCKDLIFSRARHDYHSCSCNEIAIDGGFDYIRMAFKDIMPEIIEIEINATKKQLYDDWNLRENKFGTIKDSKKNK